MRVWKVLFLAAILIFVFAVPAFADGTTRQAAADVFNRGGEGNALLKMVLLAFFGAICTYLFDAFEFGQISRMTRLVTILSCLYLVVSVAWSILEKILKFFGLV